MTHPFRREEEPKEISEVNVVPLADVSLVLLIILLVLSPMMTLSALRVQVAAESSSPALPERDPTPRPPELVLAVALDPGGISVGKRRFPGFGSFMPYVARLLASRSDKKVFLSPHPDVPNGRVVHMLEILKACGAESVALVQSQERAQQPSHGR